MLVNGTRALAYTAEIGGVFPISGADNIERVTVGGWNLIAKKGEFQVGDLCVYFEIDSKLPYDQPWAEFLAPKKFKVKTMKLSKFGVISQGLALPYSAFEGITLPDKAGVDLTKALGVTYCDAEDAIRKMTSEEQDMMRINMTHKKFVKSKFGKWIMRYSFGRRIVRFIFRKRTKNNKSFPKRFPFVRQTDEERIENMVYILQDKQPWIKTTKVDGTSSTYILERKLFGRYEFYVCSRNVRQLSADQKTFHDFNPYWYNAEKYHIREALTSYLKLHPEMSYAAIQGESYGKDLQGNPHKLPDVRFAAFNFIDSSIGRWNSIMAKQLLETYNIPWVPIIDEHYILPDDLEEFKLSADGPCEVPDSKGLREGYVYRSLDGKQSFKNVSREYLIKRHG